MSNWRLKFSPIIFTRGSDDGVFEKLEADLAAEVVGDLAPLPPLVHLGEHGRHLRDPRVTFLLNFLDLNR